MIKHKISRVRKYLGPLWWNSALMFISSRFGDIIMLYIGMFLVPAVISRDELGAILPLTTISLLLALPLRILLETALKYLNIYNQKGEKGKIKSLLKDLSLFSIFISILTIIVIWNSKERIQRDLSVEGNGIILLLAALAILSNWLPLTAIAARSLKKFNLLIGLKVITPLVRLIAMLVLLKRFQLEGYLGAQVTACVVVILFTIIAVWPYIKPSIVPQSYHSDLADIFKYMLPVAGMIACILFQNAMEPTAIRTLLSKDDSAGYYIIAMFGNIPLWVAPAMLPFLFPLVSEKHEVGECTRRIHLQALAISLTLGCFLCVFFYFAGPWILTLKSQWLVYQEYGNLIWVSTVITSLSVLMLVHSNHSNATRNFTYLWYLIPSVVLELILLKNMALIGIEKISLSAILFIMLSIRIIWVIGIILEVSFRRNKHDLC